MSTTVTRTSVFERDRYEEMLRAFRVEVLTVDWERKTLTVKDLRNGTTYQEVTNFPAHASSFEGTNVDMPEPGSRGIAVPLQSHGGFFEIAILSWIVSDTNRAQGGVATRALDIPGMQGWNKRNRGSFRKAFPGQRTSTTAEGFSEKHDDGWDRLAADLSRDHLDPQRRVHTQITSRTIHYNDGGLSLEGPVNRPGAVGVGTDLLPDGTSHAVVYLAPGATQATRYQQGLPDVTALVERTQKVQEFALDYTVPEEVLGTVLLDTALGVTADPWARTTVQKLGSISYDDQTTLANQTWDHPTSGSAQSVGPTLSEGPTPRRHGYVLERSEGTLVGSNLFDPSTYGQPLKPVVFPYTALGRFGANVESGYLSVNPSTDHVETRVAASASSVRFPHEGNTTRWDVTKEGFTSFEIGSTLPKEVLAAIPLAGAYEHPHGAGRSLEGHLVGSLKLVIGKNRDEEDAIDLQALGQTVLRLGADDASLPNVNRTVLTQNRGKNDAVLDRTLQYWDQAHVKLVPGDAVSLTNKVGAENISLRGAFDGGTVLRFGARNPAALRRHMINGYLDGPGVQAWAPGDPNRLDSKSAGRPAYAAGDTTYRFHDLTQAGKSQLDQPQLPYFWSGQPVANMDRHGLSLDMHLVEDALLRIGKNTDSGQSLLLDLAGGLVAALGKDNQGRSITASLDGGVELTIGMNQQGKALRIEFNGDVDWTVAGNFHLNVTGDSIFESASHQHVVKTDIITKAQNQFHVAMVQHLTEAPNLVTNEGLYSSDPNE